MEPLFSEFKLKEYRVTCGWPHNRGTSAKNRVIGECHSPKNSASGKIHEIFISPLLAKPVDVTGTLVHELAHVAAGVEAAHGKLFVAVCKHVGLTKGKPTHVMPGERLGKKLLEMAESIGTYPHHAIVLTGKKKLPKQSSTIALECECGCKVTIGRKHLENAGLPTCGCGGELLPSKE